MFIRYKDYYIEIKEAMTAINIEVKLNLTTEGKLWSKIGDALYYFNDIEVNFTQFEFLKRLINLHIDYSKYTISSYSH
jgi:hypothetical protein